MFRTLIIVGALTYAVPAVMAQNVYEVPPSGSTYASVPVISDEAMKQCVILYNEANWLADEIDATAVNQYSAASVNAYNAKVQRHAAMIDRFNRDCAGKQSESAWRAAQELNRQQAQ